VSALLSEVVYIAVSRSPQQMMIDYNRGATRMLNNK